MLTAVDWQAFNYVTGATPDVTSEGPGQAICQYASGLFLEVYTHANEQEAIDTFDTIVENAPFEGTTELTLPGAASVLFDPGVSDDHSGILVRAGRLVFTIAGLARDSAQAELTTLAGLALARLTQYI